MKPPEVLPALLETGLPDTAKIQPLKPASIVTSPVPSASETMGVLSAEDIPALKSHLGDTATVQGRVRSVKLVTSGSAANVYFTEADKPRVQVWIPWDPYPKVQAVLGKDLKAALENHTIRATGRLSIYRDNIELTLDDPAKLVVLP